MKLRPETTAVTAGRGPHAPGAPVNVAIPLASTYRADGDIAYGRDGNAVWQALEEVLGELEGGDALVFSSGMAAISAVLETLQAGAVVVAPFDAYIGTRQFIEDAAQRRRLSLRLVDIADTNASLDACRGADLLWAESPTNPLLAIADLTALSQGARQLGVPVAVDNTLCTPMLQRPLELGADVVVHSVSKFLSGHSDLVMGATVTRSQDWAERLLKRRSAHGGVPGPIEAFLALRGLRTLPLRMERSQENAGELAKRLSAHPQVARVRYPGLTDHPGHALAAAQMSGYGAMVSFEVSGGEEAANALCQLVKVCVSGTSLGGVETLIERRARWAGEDATPPNLIRMSVGVEHIEDLWNDLDQALAVAGANR